LASFSADADAFPRATESLFPLSELSITLALSISSCSRVFSFPSHTAPFNLILDLVDLFEYFVSGPFLGAVL
jgi:hypothetical protein